MNRHVAGVRTIVWLEYLRVKLGMDSPRAVLRHVEPEGFGKNEYGRHFHRNKSSYYSRGKHSPRKELVARADDCVQGSSALFNSVLWLLMNEDSSSKVPASEWLRTLDISVQRIIFRRSKRGSSQRKRVTTELLESLEIKGTHDSVTALAILLREAYESQSEDTLDIGRSLLRAFLVYQYQYSNISVVETLFDAFRRYIFQFASLEGNCFLLEDYPLELARFLLSDWYLMAEDNGDVDPTDANLYLIHSMDGTYSITQYHSLGPIIGPPNIQGEEDPETTWQRQMRYESLMCHCHPDSYVIAMERVRPPNYAAIPSKRFADVHKIMMRRRMDIHYAKEGLPKILWAP